MDDKDLQNEKAKIVKFVKNYAEKSGYIVNPDPDDFEMIIDGLVANKMKYGRQYCPCRPVMGDEEDRKKICPCYWHKLEIEEDGRCQCQLFFSPGKSDD